MNEWTYKRGRWIARMDYPRTLREHEAEEKLRFWGYIRRWQRFPQLGPVPERWMKYGGEPPFSVVVSETLKAIYLPAVRHWLNQPSPLMQLLEK